MKCSELWLREWVNPSLDREALSQTLTMAGFEVEEIKPVAQVFSGIIVGQVLKVSAHPKADRLSLCEVDVGELKPLHIVCGAKNVKEGMRVPVAMLGALMPDHTEIKPISIRGIVSEGMLCAASELGLTSESEGILALPDDTPIGVNFRDYFKLNDYVLDISVTPNRGDCLSVKGLAREISAITNSPCKKWSNPEVRSVRHYPFQVEVESIDECPHYVGLVMTNVNTSALTPLWLKERLERSGLRLINPIVDVTNYVMLELGQPLHAFDLNKIEQAIYVRQSVSGEKITLLDGSEKILDNQTLVIADAKKPLAIAGAMGGMDSSVTSITRDIFLESAYFSPRTVAHQRKQYGLNSESAYRFERGVDPTIQKEAILRAAQLILEIAGGDAHELIEIQHPMYLKDQCVITLPFEKVKQVLGITIPSQTIEDIFNALQFPWEKDKNNWFVKIPFYRFDLAIPEDLIEEIARLYGYDRIPTHVIKSNLKVNKESGNKHLFNLRLAFAHQGYHEIVSYSFTDKALQHLLNPEVKPFELLNPITTDMSVMQTNLWPGLIKTLLYNKSRQQQRVRLFEIGTCFIKQNEKIVQKQKLAGLAFGFPYKEQWGLNQKEIDFFDIKGDLESILLSFIKTPLEFRPLQHPSLHPSQSAAIFTRQNQIGIFGALHPSVLQELNLNNNVFVFDLELDCFSIEGFVQFHDISKFPEIRRDIALMVNETIPVKVIQDTIKKAAGDWLKDVFVFDLYQGKGISPGLKSVALALIWQHPTRTLVDDEVTALMDNVIETLIKTLGVELRR